MYSASILKLFRYTHVTSYVEKKEPPLTVAWRKLPQLQREVLELVCIDTSSYADAADILGITPKDVVTQLALARHALMSANTMQSSATVQGSMSRSQASIA